MSSRPCQSDMRNDTTWGTVCRQKCHPFMTNFKMFKTTFSLSSRQTHKKKNSSKYISHYFLNLMLLLMPVKIIMSFVFTCNMSLAPKATAFISTETTTYTRSTITLLDWASFTPYSSSDDVRNVLSVNPIFYKLKCGSLHTSLLHTSIKTHYLLPYHAHIHCLVSINFQ